MTSPLPTTAQLQNMTDLDAIVQWSGVPQATWQAFSGTMGAIPDIRIMAGIPSTVMSQGLRAVRITPTTGNNPWTRELTPVEVVQVALVWQQHAGMPDVDLLVLHQHAGGTTRTTTSAGAARRNRLSLRVDER